MSRSKSRTKDKPDSPATREEFPHGGQVSKKGRQGASTSTRANPPIRRKSSSNLEQVAGHGSPQTTPNRCESLATRFFASDRFDKAAKVTAGAGAGLGVAAAATTAAGLAGGLYLIAAPLPPALWLAAFSTEAMALLMMTARGEALARRQAGEATATAANLSPR